MGGPTPRPGRLRGADRPVRAGERVPARARRRGRGPGRVPRAAGGRVRAAPGPAVLDGQHRVVGGNVLLRARPRAPLLRVGLEAQAHAAGGDRRAGEGLRAARGVRHLLQPVPARRAGGGDAVRGRGRNAARARPDPLRHRLRDLVRVPRRGRIVPGPELAARRGPPRRRQPRARHRRRLHRRSRRPPLVAGAPETRPGLSLSAPCPSRPRSGGCARASSRRTIARARRPSLRSRGRASRAGRRRAGSPW